jgi:hypothetical protein
MLKKIKKITETEKCLIHLLHDTSQNDKTPYLQGFQVLQM